MSEQSVTILIAVIFLLLNFGITVFVMVAGWIFITWQKGSGRKDEQLDRSSARQSQDTIDALKHIDERVQVVERLTDRIEFQVTPLWAKVQKQLSEDLHHPHAKDREADDLLDKLESLTITAEETARLKVLMHHRQTDPGVSSDERESASIYAVVMDKVLKEQKSESTVELELVSIPTVVAEDQKK